MEKIIVGKCPLCGGDVIKICKGYKCSNALTEQPACSFQLNNMVCNRFMSDDEIESLLASRRILLDGFCTNEHKNFTAVLVLDDQGATRIESKIGSCPACGGDIYVGGKSFSCANYRREAAPCRFTIWRSYGGHMVSLAEAEEILSRGITSANVVLFGENGVPYEKRLGLSPDKLQVVKF